MQIERSQTRFYWRLGLMLATLCSVAGIIVGVYLTQHHFRFIAGAGGKSMCNVSQFINCDAVTASSHAELFGVTLSTLSIIFFGWHLIILWTALRQPPNAQRKLHGLILIATVAIATVYGLYLEYVAIVRIGAMCMFCTLMRVVLIVQLVITIVLFRRHFAGVNLPHWPKLLGGSRVIKVGFIQLFFALLCALPLLWWESRLAADAHQQTAVAVKTVLSQLQQQSPRPISIRGCPTKGDDKAPVTIVEFSDFECPFCKKATHTLQSVIQGFEGQVRLVFKHFPLDSTCNMKIGSKMHPYACQLATASICAHEQGRFWDYHNALFALSSRPNGTTKDVIAKQLQLDMDQFRACLSSEAAYKRLRDDIRAAYRFKISGTPAFLINGRLISGLLPAAAFQAAIEMTLKWDGQSTN